MLLYHMKEKKKTWWEKKRERMDNWRSYEGLMNVEMRKGPKGWSKRWGKWLRNRVKKGMKYESEREERIAEGEIMKWMRESEGKVDKFTLMHYWNFMLYNMLSIYFPKYDRAELFIQNSIQKKYQLFLLLINDSYLSLFSMLKDQFRIECIHDTRMTRYKSLKKDVLIIYIIHLWGFTFFCLSFRCAAHLWCKKSKILPKSLHCQLPIKSRKTFVITKKSGF